MSAQAAVIFDTITGVTAGAGIRAANPGNPQRTQGSAGNPGNALIVNGGPLATSFVLTNTTQLTKVVLNLQKTAAGNGGAVIYIVPDNGSTSPLYTGSGLGLTFGAGTQQFSTAIADSDVTVATSAVTRNGSLVLSPGTYWLALQTDMDLITPGIQQGTMNATSSTDFTSVNVTNSIRWLAATSYAPAGANLSGQIKGFDFAQFTSGSPGVYTTGSTAIAGVLMATIEGTIVTNEQEAPEPATLAVLGAGLLGMGVARRFRNRKAST